MKKRTIGGLKLPNFNTHYKATVIKATGFPGGLLVKNLPASAGAAGDGVPSLCQKIC